MEIMDKNQNETSIVFSLDIDRRNYYNLSMRASDITNDASPEDIYNDLFNRYHEAWKKLAGM